MNFPKITIVTPSFNQGQFLEQTIVSILDQNYPNLEYIIIDGGSKDQSISIIKKYESRLAYWVSEADRGQSDAINKGLKKATGDIFNWINSDDYMEQGSLFLIANAFLDNPNATCVSGKCSIFDNETKNIRNITHGVTLYDQNLAKTIGWAAINQPETFFKLNVIKEIGLANENLHYNMDKELWIRYLLSFGQNNVVRNKISRKR